MKIKLQIVQLEAVAGDIEKNINKAEELLKGADEKCADLILLPELWTIGWDCDSFNKSSEDIFSSRTYNFLSEKDRNTSLIFNRNGELIAVYDKYHLFSHRGQSEGTYLQAGENGLLVNTDIGKIGISICYDIRFPELFRQYAFKNADFIVNMAAWPKSYVDEYITLAKARAVENQLFFAAACLTGKINETYEFSGNSMVIDYKGRVIAKLNREEKVLCSQIDTGEMHEYRKQMPILKDTKKIYKVLEK